MGIRTGAVNGREGKEKGEEYGREGGAWASGKGGKRNGGDQSSAWLSQDLGSTDQTAMR